MKRNRYFQWIAGENCGTVTTLNNISEYDGEYFYNFNDGESCNQRFVAKMTSSPNDIKSKFVVEINSPNDPWKIEKIKSKKYTDSQTQERVEVPALDDITGASGNGQSLSIDKSHVGEIKYIAPTYRGPFYDLPSLDDYMLDVTLKNNNVAVKEQDKSAVFISSKKTKDNNALILKDNNIVDSDKMNPIKIIIDKCKRRAIDVNMNISINVPSVNVFKIADEDFEDGANLFVQYVIDTINVNDIKDALKTALLEEYRK